MNIDGCDDASEPRAIEPSDEARQVSSLAVKAGELADVRAEKVTAIRRDLENGTYRVDPERLARAIVEFEDDLDR